MTDSQLLQLVPSALMSPRAVEASMVARKIEPKTSREEVEEIDVAACAGGEGSAR